MARHVQIAMPTGAKVGDSWEHPTFAYRRVLSRGGSWENVTGGTHPDEVQHEETSDEQQSGTKAKSGDVTGEVPSGTGEPASGDGDDREAVSEPGKQGEVAGEVGGEGEGIDGTTPPVV